MKRKQKESENIVSKMIQRSNNGMEKLRKSQRRWLRKIQKGDWSGTKLVKEEAKNIGEEAKKATKDEPMETVKAKTTKMIEDEPNKTTTERASEEAREKNYKWIEGVKEENDERAKDVRP